MMQLTYRFCDDWLIFAQADDASWWMVNTETWPEWLDAAEDAGIDPADHTAVEQLTSAENAVERHMVPRVTAWNTQLSPTASPVSHPAGEHLGGVKRRHRLGVIGFACWERVPDGGVSTLLARPTAGAPRDQAR